jgi:hypothetical protein
LFLLSKTAEKVGSSGNSGGEDFHPSIDRVEGA